MSKNNPKILIIGSGLAGLGASVHLKQAGYNPIILEAEERAGGLFTNYSLDGCDFDYGPKLLILDESENSKELLSYLGKNVEKYPVAESVYLEQFGILKFPLQRYLIELPKEERKKAIDSLKEAQSNPIDILNFKDWLVHHYGEYFANLILIPYEEKKWRIKLEEMDYRWALSRPVKVSLDEVIEGSKKYLPPKGVYYYPKKGNIDTFTQNVVKKAGKILYNHPVSKINLKKKYVIAGGEKYEYDILISTAPLDTAVEMTSDLPEKMKDFSSHMLKRLKIVVFNLVFEGNHNLEGTAIYFPEKEFIFRRVSVLQNLCPALKREGKTPITVEVSVGKEDVNHKKLYEEVIEDLLKVEQFAKMGKPSNYEAIDVDFAYPLQTRGHSYHVADLHRYYGNYDVYHCGRGGSFNYCNGDFAYKQGVDTAHQIINLLEEQSMKDLTFTIGLPSYNSGESIIQTVRSIRNSVGVAQDFPIIIAVDGPTLDSNLEKELKTHDVTILHNKERKGQTARNEQIMQTAKTDIVILTQDDVLFKEDTIAKILNTFADDPKLTMVAPKVSPLPAQNLFEQAIHRGVSIAQYMTKEWNNGDNYLASIGRCLAYRTDMAQKFEVPKKVINCDAYYYFENRRLAGNFRYQNEAEVNYRSPQNMEDHVKQVRKFVVSEKELSSYLKMDLNVDYKPPSKLFLSALAREFVISPTLTGYYLWISIQARSKSKEFYNEVTHLWETDPSTKQL